MTICACDGYCCLRPVRWCSGSSQTHVCGGASPEVCMCHSLLLQLINRVWLCTSFCECACIWRDSAFNKRHLPFDKRCYCRLLARLLPQCQLPGTHSIWIAPCSKQVTIKLVHRQTAPTPVGMLLYSGQGIKLSAIKPELGMTDATLPKHPPSKQVQSS